MIIIILRKNNHNLSFIVSHITYSFFTTFFHNTNYFIVQTKKIIVLFLRITKKKRITLPLKQTFIFVFMRHKN